MEEIYKPGGKHCQIGSHRRQILAWSKALVVDHRASRSRNQFVCRARTLGSWRKFTSLGGNIVRSEAIEGRYSLGQKLWWLIIGRLAAAISLFVVRGLWVHGGNLQAWGETLSDLKP